MGRWVTLSPASLPTPELWVSHLGVPTCLLWLRASAEGSGGFHRMSRCFSPSSEAQQTKAFVLLPLLGPTTAQGGKLLASQQLNFAAT